MVETDSSNTELNHEIASIRRVLSQVLACTGCNLLVFSIGLVLSFPTVLLGALFNHPTESLNLTNDEASWFASLSMLCQPIGSIISGYLVKPLGWKRSMLLLNVPFFICWTMTFFAESLSMLYSSSVVMGLAIGLTEAPMLTYVGEVSEPKYRGALSAYCQLYFQLATLVVYGLGSALSWRYTAACCAVVPLITALAVSKIPESPLWLISKGRIEDAEKALCWLRGWTKPEAVKEEFNQLLEYTRDVNLKKKLEIEKSVSTNNQYQEPLVEVKMSLRQRIVYFWRPTMRRPLILIVWLFFFIYGTGFSTVRPYFMHIFDELKVDTDHYQVAVLIGVTSVFGNLSCLIVVGYTGKKGISIASFIGCAISTLILALVAYLVFPYSMTLPFLYIWTFFSSFGIFSIPWMLQSELYPYEGKCVAAGLASAASYLMGFIAIKTFLYLEDVLELSGMFVLYTCTSIFGAIFVIIRLPETEGFTFDKIESKFTY